VGNDSEARAEIRTLCRRAVDALIEGAFRHAAEPLVRAVAIAERLGDLALLVRAVYLFAFTRRQLGDLQGSLEGTARLMALASNPLHRARLSDDEPALAALADSFALHADAGRVDGVSVGALRAVLDGGLAFLSTVGRPPWAHGLQLQRGLLRLLQGRMRSALENIRRALRRRQAEGSGPGGFTVCRHLAELAAVLATLGRRRLARSLCLRVYREHPTGLCRLVRQRTCTLLSEIAAVEGNLTAAGRWARRAEMLTRPDDADEFRVPAVAALVRVLLSRGRIAAATRRSAALHDVSDSSPPSVQFTAAVTLCEVALARRERPAASAWLRRAAALGRCLEGQSGRNVSSHQLTHLHRRLIDPESANGTP
jgi:hypothetical protein